MINGLATETGAIAIESQIMRVTQGAFSFLPDLNDTQICAQIEYCLRRGWAVGLEHTDDAHPRNTFWQMYGNPMFDLQDAGGAMRELQACREAFPNHYVRVNAFDATRGWETVRLSFIVNRPANEPGLRLQRIESTGRVQRYAIVR